MESICSLSVLVFMSLYGEQRTSTSQLESLSTEKSR